MTQDTQDTLEAAVKYALEFSNQMPMQVVKRLRNALANYTRTKGESS